MKLITNYLNKLKQNFIPVLGMVLFMKLAMWYVIPFFKGAPAQPPTPNQIVSLCLKAYKDSGLTGLKALSEESYSELSKRPTLQELEKVAIIDMFSYQLDKEMASYVGFPQDEYFSVNGFQKRIGVYFKSMEISNDEINKIVRKWEADVNQEMKKMN